MEKPKHSIQRLFLRNVLILLGVLLLSQAVIAAFQIKGSMEEQVEENLESRANAIAGEINQRLLTFRLKAEGFALAATSLPVYEEDPLYRILNTHIESDPMIVGGGFWFAPYVYDSQRRFVCGYSEKDGNGGIRIPEGYVDGNYDYTEMGWYHSGQWHVEKASWTGPYRDEVTGVPMLTATCGLWKDKRFDGCVTLDVGMSEMEEYIQGVRVGQTGHAFFVRQDGMAIGMMDKGRELNILEDDYVALEEVRKKIVDAREVTLFETEVHGKDCYIIAAPLTIDTLKLVLIAPKSDYRGVIWRYAILTLVMVFAVVVAIILAVRIMFQRRIYRPIRDLVAASETIAQGGEAELKTDNQDEIGYLARSFQNMSQKLRDRNALLRKQYLLLADKHRALEEALANVETMRVSRDSYKMESETDKLTGLLNKAATCKLIDATLATLAQDKIAALYILDLDHFKEANDTYGHQYGDLILQGFAAVLRNSFRPTDIIGRFGGDEFVVLISGLPDRKIAEQKAKQLLQAARELEADGRKAGITSSIGISLAPLQGSSYEELFAAADRCLYKVKNQGRDGYCIGTDEQVHHDL